MKPRTGRQRPLLAALLAAVCLFGAARADRVITLSFTGDCTIGCEERMREREDSFDAYAARYGYAYFFENFSDLFSRDDCTVINLEGVFQDSAAGERTEKTYRFRGRTEYVEILKAGSVELAGLANNHVGDYGARALARTTETLEAAGIGWTRASDCWFLEKDGIRICFFATDYSIANTQGERIRKRMAEMRAKGEADAIVVLFHNGNEYDPKHTSLQEKMGNVYVTNGADLVIMHHSHVVQGVQVCNNRTVCYSLGNFVFGGNKDIRTSAYRNGRTVTSRYGLVVQARLHFSDDGTYLGQQVTLIPIQTSSATPANNYQPARLTAVEAEPVMEAVRYDTGTMELPGITEDESGYARVIMPYLSAGNEPEAPVRTDGSPEPPAARPGRNNR